jgi:predicted HTH domain antitoxin
MSRITVEIPGSVTEAEARLYLAMKLYEVGRLSSGQAAELAGYSRAAFLELLGRHGIAVFDQDPGDLAGDLRHA